MRAGRGRFFRQRGGFTAIEIIAALIVVGVLAVVAFSRFGSANSAAVAEADALKAALRYAQARAMADVYTWGITVSTSSYTLITNNSHVTTVLLPGGSGATRTLSSGVTVTGGTGTVYFDWRGEPVSAAITDPATAPTQVTSSTAITLRQTADVVVTVLPYTGFVQ